MYKISYEKCVCFIFLVILAVLSCSGFRIDNLAMTDISKRNSHTSSSLLNSDEFFDRLFSVNATTFRHRIRHHRQLRGHTSRAPTPHPNEHFAQIPSTDLHQNPLPPTRSNVRSQRSNDQKRSRRQNLCPDHDVSWKAYKADAIVVARVESKSSKCRENCTVLFRLIETLKNSSFPVDGRFSLKLSTDRGTTNCEYDDPANRSQFLVRTKIDQSKEYILFLNPHGAHNYSAAFAPEIRKKGTIGTIKRVINPNFKPRPLRLQLVSPEKRDPGSRLKRLKLTCKVKGFPIPMIKWKYNNETIHPNQRQRITQKKRKSTLVIRSLTEANSGVYECFVRGVDGTERSSPYHVPPIDNDEICRTDMDQVYCQNGGTCFYTPIMKEYRCECRDGYTGLRCDQKSSDQSSMYRQTPIYTCKVGLFTKYNC